MPERERRSSEPARGSQLRNELSEEQRFELATLEHFGWQLKFIRRPMFAAPIPVVVDSDTQRHAVLQPDGSLDENPEFDIRH
jgi:hypothetical protein